MNSLLPYNGRMWQELPIPVRLEVYKKMEILIIERDWGKYGISGPWLCLTLPCVLWDLSSVNNTDPNGYNWSTKDTKIAFPELSDEVLKTLDSICGNATPQRLEFIREWIVKLKNQLKNEQTTL